MEEEYKRLMEEKQKRGLNDLYFFNKYIVEQREDRRKFIVPHVHGEWATWLTNSKKRIKMILVPRSTFKSTFVTCGYTLQSIAKNRDIKILIANATTGNAARFLTEIKEHLVKNEEFRMLYGEFYNPKLKWNENEIEVIGRRMGSREATVTAAGVGGNLISTHFNLILADDLVNDENSATRLQANKVIDWWKRAFSLLEPDGTMIIIGTRFTYYELYSYLIDNLSDEVDMFIRSIYNPDGSMYFPERFNEEKVTELKKLHGSWLFSSFFLNEPLDEDSAIIKASQIQYYENPPTNMVKFACCDPAVSQSIHADFSAIVVVGVDVNDNWFVLETIRGRWQVSELIFQLFDVFDRWHPTTMTIETIGQAQGLLSPIHDEEEVRKKYLPLVVIKSRGEITKNMRVRSILQPRFENKKIYIKKDMFELEDEIIHFPNSKHDDLIECAIGSSKVRVKGGVKCIKDIKEGDFVLTRYGHKKVLKSWMTGRKKVITRFGITATPNHPMITTKGIKRFDSVKDSDIMYTWNEKQSYIEEKSIIAIRNQNADNFGFIFGDTTNGKLPLSLCTDRFGLITLGQFPLVMLFIIKTVIHQITISPILRLLQEVNTKKNTWLIRQKLSLHTETASSFKTISRKLKSLLQSGIVAKWERSNSLKHQRKDGKLKNRKLKSVYSVTRNIKHIFQTLCTVGITVLTNTAEELKKQKVYNLHVEGKHEFFINDILVHNCLSDVEEIGFAADPKEEKNIKADSYFGKQLESKVHTPNDDYESVIADFY